MTDNQYRRLFHLASKFLKYFLLLLLGFAIAYVMSMSFGALTLASSLLPLIMGWVWRLGLALVCLFALAMIIESVN
jgi:hypothetical protein